MLSNLKAEMVRHNISRSKLADLINVTYGTITQKINGHNSFTIDEANLIKKTFFPSLSLDYLFAKGEENDKGNESIQQ